MVHLARRQRDKRQRTARAGRWVRFWSPRLFRRRARKLATWAAGEGPSFVMNPPIVTWYCGGYGGEHTDEEIKRALELARHNRVRRPTLMRASWD